MHKNSLLTCLAIIFICTEGTYGLNRRLTEALENANRDFLSFEGNRKPAVPPATKPGQPVISSSSTSTTTTPTATTPSTVKPTTPVSGVKQLINKFNDRTTDYERQGPLGNRQNPATQNTNLNRQNSNGPGINTQGHNRPDLNLQSNSGPATPTKPQPGTVSSTPTKPQPGTGSSTLTKPQPGQPGIGNLKPSVGLPTREAFPGLPNSGGTTVAAPAVPTKPLSWSSVVAGNSKPGGSPPNISPGNTPKSSQFLKPFVIGEDIPPATASPRPASAGTVKELVSDNELKDISEALLRKDTNNAAKYITVNYQGKTSSFSKDDVAPQPLLTVQQAAWSIPTIAAMKVLLDNYEQDTTVNEHVTAQEKTEENEFLDAIMATPVIRHLMTFLKEKGLVTPDPRQQRDVLKQIWFNMYSRGQGKIGSSGFEHIFVSEIKNGEVSGLHSWIYFQAEEAANRANYLGYLKKIELADKGAILKLHFNMKGIDKPVDTMFIGTSPELEIALYSLCFLTRVDRACPLTLAGQNFNLRTHNFRYRSKNMIGSAFPEI